MADNAQIWNAFIPTNMLQTSSVFLTGCIDEAKSSVYITGTRSTYVNCENDLVVGDFTSSNTVQESRIPAAAVAKVWLNVCRTSTNSVVCRLYRSGTVQPYANYRCVPVLFDPLDIVSSFILAEGAQECFPSENSQTQVCSSQTQVCRLFSVYSKKQNTTDGTSASLKVKDSSIQMHKNAFTWCIYTLIVLFGFAERLLIMISFKWCWAQICVQMPAILNNITFKLKRFKGVQSKVALQQRSKLMLFDVCGQQLLDSMLGVTFMLYVIHSGFAETIAAAVMHWADDTAKNLSDLLHWLMGAPAGLKLNAQLTEYMGHFFLYHVYLWSGYLSVLRPVLSWVIWIAACFGTLGLSAQLCLVQDIISMLTLHIYCFYVYAARLYSLQTYALASLWRLFRGKKWNVLRLRVDSAQYTIDQLCVGTLLFTVLLFLLPTSLLYYCVFTALRLLMLSLHGLLTLAIDGINMVPAATVILRAFKSKLVAGDLNFTVLQDAEYRGVVLSMQTTQFPMQKLYLLGQAHMKTECHQQEHQQQYSWTELMQRLISGSLVYPWVNPYDLACKEKTL